MTYASFSKRLAAHVIDIFIISIPYCIFFGTFHLFDFFSSIGLNAVVAFLYRPFFESSVMEATPGKALMNISVKTEGGERLSFKQACIRHFASYLSFVVMYAGYLMQLFTGRRQTLHDMIAEAVVVENTTPAPDFNYFRVWKNQFQAVMDQL